MSGHQIDHLAGGLRTAISRLSFHLRTPATRQGITPTRLTAMASLEFSGPMRPGDLAARLSISAASMSRLTEAMVEGGWVERAPDPDDRRACLLNLSEHGSAALTAMRQEGTSWLSKDIAALPTEQQAVLAAALPILQALADKRLEPEP